MLCRMKYYYISLAVFFLDFYSSQQFQSWNPNDDVGDRSKDNSAAFSNCIPGFVSRQRLILIDIKDKEVRIGSQYYPQENRGDFDKIVIMQ